MWHFVTRGPISQVRNTWFMWGEPRGRSRPPMGTRLQTWKGVFLVSSECATTRYWVEKAKGAPLFHIAVRLPLTVRVLACAGQVLGARGRHEGVMESRKC